MRRLLLSLALLVAVSANAQEDDWQRGYEQYKKQAMQEYEDYRKQCLAEYIDYVRQAWKEYGVKAPVEPPKENRVIMPVLGADSDAETASWFGDLVKGIAQKVGQPLRRLGEKKRRNKSEPLPVKEVVEIPHEPQPQPVSEVVERQEEPNDYDVFTVYGTTFRVRFGDNCRFRLNSVSEDDVADAMRLFLKPQFDNMLYDCLQERQRHGLSDWAYYQMLKVFTDRVYGAKSNEATLVLSYLFSGSGYKVRMARDDDQKLYMMVSSQYSIYRKYAAYLDGADFYFLDDDAGSKSVVLICEAKFPKEGSLSLQIPAVQQLSVQYSDERTITSWAKNEDFSFTVRSNKNYLSFIDTYPDGQFSGKPMTRWAIRANTPMEKSVADQLYPQIREKLKGLSRPEAVNQLLWWIQWGLKYEYDEKLWGRDRVFFAEESLFYPYCDCEDRAILLSRLVRDLLGLDVLLLYYENGILPDGSPAGGHMASAVCFPDEDGVEGDFIPHVGKKFYVCDPTIINGEGNIGVTMSYYAHERPTVVLLERTFLKP